VWPATRPGLDKRCAHSARTLAEYSEPLDAARRASPFFDSTSFSAIIVKHLLRQELPQARILVLQLAQPFGLSGLHCGALLAPAIERLLDDSQLPACVAL
jgi:hypothetical protein